VHSVSTEWFGASNKPLAVFLAPEAFGALLPRRTLVEIVRPMLGRNAPPGHRYWAATTQERLPQGSRRILLEPRGTRRLSSQSLLDL
jgi:hypothetical protein